MGLNVSFEGREMEPLLISRSCRQRFGNIFNFDHDDMDCDYCPRSFQFVKAQRVNFSAATSKSLQINNIVSGVDSQDKTLKAMPPKHRVSDASP